MITGSILTYKPLIFLGHATKNHSDYRGLHAPRATRMALPIRTATWTPVLQQMMTTTVRLRKMLS